MNSYKLDEKDRQNVRSIFNISDEEVKEKVELLKKWIETCPDLPTESQDDSFLNIMLLRAKFRDEYVKKNIQNYYKTIRRYPEIFSKLGKFKPSEEVGVAVASPKLTSSWERIGVLKLSQKVLATKSLDIDQLIIVIVTTGMIMFTTDYAASFRFFLDFTGVTLRDLFKVNIRTLFKLVHITEDMLRIRISGIEMYNAPYLVSALLNIARILLKPKIFQRISVHRDLPSLYEKIPRECLPFDYGGEVENTDKLIEIWDSIVEEQKPFFDKIALLSQKGKEDNNA